VILWTNFNYSNLIGAETVGLSLLGVFLRYFTIVLFILYFFMRFYFYQMIVTAKIPFFGILKNGWLFAVLGLGRNILAAAAIFLSLMVMLFVHPMIELLTIPLIGFSFCGFIAVYTTYPIIEKYIIKPVREAEKAEDDQEIREKLDGRGGELPPELGGPGAGSHDDQNK
jgi:hypothetical protein